MLLLALSAHAARLDLGPSDDWCAAIAAAAPGTEVSLSAGDYAGPCWIRQSVTIIGHDSRIVYDGASSNVLDIEADDVELMGLAFGPTQPDIDAIKIRSGARISVSLCSFTGVGGISVSANSADTADVHLIGNTFTDLAATGVYLGCHDGSCASSDLFVANNRFDGVTSSGVGYAIETKLNSWGTIGGNDIRDAQGPGITVYGSENGDVTEVSGNVLVGSRTSATLEIAGGPANVVNNVVIGGPNGGLQIYDYGDRGLLTRLYVAGNTLWGAGGPAATISGVDGLDLTFFANAAGRDDGATALPDAPTASPWIANVDCGDGTTCWNDPSALDFWPLAGGALLAAGDYDDDLPGDFCGVTRPARITAGALEPGTPTTPSFAAFAEREARCPPVTWDTGSPTDDTGPVADPDEPPPPGCGCASSGNAGGAALLGVVLAAGLAARRGRAA